MFPSPLKLAPCFWFSALSIYPPCLEWLFLNPNLSGYISAWDLSFVPQDEVQTPVWLIHHTSIVFNLNLCHSLSTYQCLCTRWPLFLHFTLSNSPPLSALNLLLEAVLKIISLKHPPLTQTPQLKSPNSAMVWMTVFHILFFLWISCIILKLLEGKDPDFFIFAISVLSTVAGSSQ